MKFLLSSIICAVSVLAILGCSQSMAFTPTTALHRSITVTTFWVGEDASSENAYIANAASAWDDHW
jgi:ABC-type glycerol-3-phosphate transport system substrate-binding protein